MPVSAPVPSSSSSTRGVERRRRAVAEAAPPRPTTAVPVLDLAPVRRSRRRRRSRSARRARAPRAIASSVASGAARCAPEAKTTARSQGAPPSPRRRRDGRLQRGRARRRGRSRGRCRCGRACPLTIRHGIRRARRDAARAAARHRRVRPDRRGQDRRRDRARRAAARRRRGPGRRVGRRAAGLRGPADPHRRGRPPRSARGSSTACVGFVPVDGDVLAPAPTRAAPTRRSTRCSRQGRRPIVVGGTGLYLRAALAELDLRPPVAARDPRALERAAAAARRAGAPRRAAARARGRRRSQPTDRQRIIRALELLDAGHAPPPRAGAPLAAVDRATRATRRCSPALTMDRDELYRAHRRPRRRDARRRRARGGAGRRRRRRVGHRPRARSASSELLDGDVEAMKHQDPPLRQAPADVAAQAARASHLIDVTGRDAGATSPPSCTP